jgi:Glycosyltransferase like family
VIVVGVCVGGSGQFERIALPSITRCLGKSALVVERRSQTSIFDAYNSILDEVCAMPELEAVILMHDDVELQDRDLTDKLRSEFGDSSVGLVGLIGAVNMTHMRWHHFESRGSVSTPEGLLQFEPVRAEVDAIDGLFMALPPIAAVLGRFPPTRALLEFPHQV